MKLQGLVFLKVVVREMDEEVDKEIDEEVDNIDLRY